MTFIKELKSRGHSPRSGQRPGKAQLTPACAKSVRAPRVLQFKRESRVPLHTGRGLHGLNFEESPERTEQWACRVLAGAEEPGGPEMPGEPRRLHTGRTTPRRRLQTNPGARVSNNQPGTVTHVTRQIRTIPCTQNKDRGPWKREMKHVLLHGKD